MLLNKFKKDDVISLKLINGDELVALYKEEFGDTITISNPCVLTMGPGGAIGMIPWCFLSESKDHVISKSKTFTIARTKKEACDQYLENAVNMEVKV